MTILSSASDVERRTNGTAPTAAISVSGVSKRHGRGPGAVVALDGISLTVNEVEGSEFGVNLIPHTQEVTTWGTLHEGQPVNLEVDTMARYVARLREWA